MRKTLTVLTLIAVAGSLAACKMPWDSGDKAEGYARTPVESANPAPPATSTPAAK